MAAQRVSTEGTDGTGGGSGVTGPPPVGGAFTCLLEPPPPHPATPEKAKAKPEKARAMHATRHLRRVDVEFVAMSLVRCMTNPDRLAVGEYAAKRDIHHVFYR